MEEEVWDFPAGGAILNCFELLPDFLDSSSLLLPAGFGKVLPAGFLRADFNYALVLVCDYFPACFPLLVLFEGLVSSCPLSIFWTSSSSFYFSYIIFCCALAIYKKFVSTFVSENIIMQAIPQTNSDSKHCLHLKLAHLFCQAVFPLVFCARHPILQA